MHAADGQRGENCLCEWAREGAVVSVKRRRGCLDGEVEGGSCL